MLSFQTKIDERRQTYLHLSAEIERQLREAYHVAFSEEGLNQSEVARRLGINRSTVHHRLTGQVNMTTETIADMVWALGRAISVTIYDPRTDGRNNQLPLPTPAPSSALTDATKELLRTDKSAAAVPLPGVPFSLGTAA